MSDNHLTISVLDINTFNHMVIVYNNGELITANNSFLDFFSFCSSLEAFTAKHIALSELFIEVDLGFNYLTHANYRNNSWVEYVYNSFQSHRVALVKDEKLYHFKLEIEYVKKAESKGIYLVHFFDITEEMNLNKRLLQLNLNLKTLVEEKAKALKNLNEDLIVKIEQEVEKSHEKDRILYHQAKMASMGEMLGNIAHQWRQPLSMISTSASGVKLQKENDILTDEFFYESMDGIVSHAQHLSETINDFRDFFKPNKKSKKFDLESVLFRTSKLIDSQLKKHETRIIREPASMQMYGYESELIQVLMNLINNSCEAFEHNKCSKHYIFINILQEGENIIIEVKDNAQGIEEAILDRVFEPYFTTKHQSHGTGIGLYMTEEIVTKHMQGTINVKNVNFTYQNNEYKGALFTLTLPKNLQ